MALLLTTARAMAPRCAPTPTDEHPATAGPLTAFARPLAVRAARCASSKLAALPAAAASIAPRSPTSATEHRPARAWQPACARAQLAAGRSPARNKAVKSRATTAFAEGPVVDGACRHGLSPDSIPRTHWAAPTGAERDSGSSCTHREGRSGRRRTPDTRTRNRRHLRPAQASSRRSGRSAGRDR